MAKAYVTFYRELLRELKRHYPRPETYASIKKEVRYHYMTHRRANENLVKGREFLQFLRDYRWRQESWLRWRPW